VKPLFNSGATSAEITFPLISLSLRAGPEFNMREPKPPLPESTLQSAEEAALRARLEALKSDLGEQIAEQKDAGKNAGAPSESGKALAVGMRAASELVAGVLVGSGLGYFLDQHFGTKPVFLIILMMLGIAAGFVNIARLGMRPTVLKAGTVEKRDPDSGHNRG
jgi:ATP synthase protein I